MSWVTIYRSELSGGRGRSDELLSLCAARFTGDSGPWEARRPFGEKPFFPKDASLGFSVTHSGGLWMCAMSRRPVGLDLQARQSCSVEAVSRRFLHPDEDAWLAAGGYQRFFDLWAAKESYLKYTGEGIVNGLNHFSLVSEGHIRREYGGARLISLPCPAGFSLWLCTAGESEIRTEDI